MSIVALKRKANAKYSTHSRGSLGFALNGTIRPRGRVGQTSLMSRGTSSGNLLLLNTTRCAQPIFN